MKFGDTVHPADYQEQFPRGKGAVKNKTIHATTKIFKELSDPVIFSSLKKQERTERHPWCVG